MPSYLSNWAGPISNPTFIDSAAWLQYFANASSRFQSAADSIDQSTIVRPTATTATGSFYDGSTFVMKANSFISIPITVTSLSITTADSAKFLFEGKVTVNLNTGSESGQLNHLAIQTPLGEKLDVYGTIKATSPDASITKLVYHDTNGGTIELKGAFTYYGQTNNITGTVSAFSNTDKLNHSYQLTGLSIALEELIAFNDYDAFITTTMAGDDVLNGTSDAEVMRGFGGDDTYWVNNIDDLVIENKDQGSADLVNVGIAKPFQTYLLTNNVEHAALTNKVAFNLIGNALDNILTGNGKNNIIAGGAGADSLDGGAGNDTVSYAGSSKAVNVTINGATTTTGQGGDAEGDSLKNFENISGSSQNDTLTGNAGANTLDGSLGDDTLTGGAGNDIYFVDSSKDLIVENAAGGMDLVYSTATSYTLADNVETLILTDDGNINGYGNDLANALIGNGGNNYLAGGKGKDVLIGGGGNDTLDGWSDGSDTLRGGKGDDIYYVSLIKRGSQAVLEDSSSEARNEGLDTLTLIAEDSSYVAIDLGLTKATTITLPANFEVLDATRTHSNKLNFVGNAMNNFIKGNNADNLISGDAGDDKLEGGEGNDILKGGTGHDLFAISALGAGNADTITDFASGIDRILLDTAIIDGLTDNNDTSLSAAEFTNGGTANSATQRIVYDPATGKLYYDNDGNGVNAQVEIATVGINTHPALSSSDFFVDWGA